MRFHLCCWALDVWYVLVTGNAWVVCMPFRGGPVRANLLVRVDCQAYRPTHFTIWLYSYGRSGTLTVSAHKNTTLTPTTPDESSQSCKPMRVWERNKNDPFALVPYVCNLHHLKNITSTFLRPTPRYRTHFFLYFFFLNGKYFRVLVEESMAIQRMFRFHHSTGIQENCQWDIWTMRSNKKALRAAMFTEAVSLGTSQMTTTLACTKDLERQTQCD